MWPPFDHATRREASRRVSLAAMPLRATPAFLGTFWRGADAAVRGEPRSAPYVADGRTWSTAFARYWIMGYDAARERARKEEG